MGGLFNINEGLVKAQSPDAGVANFDGEVALITSYDIIDDRGNGIGYITQFNPSHSRPATRIRSIGSADAGRTIEQAPGVEDVTVQVTGFALYNRQNVGSLIQRIGGESVLTAMKSLKEQHIHFTIAEIQRDPATKKALDVVLYLDCWITNYSSPKNISQATIAETATISVGEVVRPLNFQSF